MGWPEHGVAVLFEPAPPRGASIGADPSSSSSESESSRNENWPARDIRPASSHLLARGCFVRSLLHPTHTADDDNWHILYRNQVANTAREVVHSPQNGQRLIIALRAVN